MKLNTITHKSAVVAAAAACIATSTLHGQIDGSKGINMGYHPQDGRIFQAAPLADISSAPASYPDGWYTSGLSDLIAPVAQFTGYDPNANIQLPVVDLIPLKTPRIEVTTNGSTGGVPTMLAKDGRVGIGTATPEFPLHVVSTLKAGLCYTDIGVTFDYYGVHPYDLPTGEYVPLRDVSIFAAGAVVSQSIMWSPCFQAQQAFYVSSDSRLKEVIGVSDASKDLATLNGIAITDYLMKDKSMVGNQAYKKVIAQDVEKIFPQAVSKSVGAIPDVMVPGEAAAVEGGFLKITLARETDLKPGERVEFRNRQNTPETAVIHAVDKNTLTVALKHVNAGEKAFVYGREVNDLRTVDYDALSMLNISATQELSRKVAALETENAQLRKLAAKVEKMESLVAALEGKANGTVTVSLNK